MVVAGEDPARVEHARRFNDEWVFEFWDMVSRSHATRSWEARPHTSTSSDSTITGPTSGNWAARAYRWPTDDPRRVPLADLVRAAWRRYGSEILITETSALGEARAPWIHELSQMAEQLLAEGMPLGGICLYPILGMPEWHARDHWARMGLWDLEREQDVLQRIAYGPMMTALRAVQGR